MEDDFVGNLVVHLERKTPTDFLGYSFPLSIFQVPVFKNLVELDFKFYSESG